MIHVASVLSRLLKREARSGAAPPTRDGEPAISNQGLLEWVDDQENTQRTVVLSCSQNTSGISVVTPNPLPLEKTMTFRDGSTSFRVFTTTCNRHDSFYRCNLLYVAGGRRRADREAVSGTAWMQSDSHPTCEVTVTNISADGAQVISATPLLPGALVRLRGVDIVRLGLVRYVSHYQDEYLIGIRFCHETHVHIGAHDERYKPTATL